LYTAGGDPDLYAIFSNHSEPGLHNYHYRSMSYSAVSDVIEVSVNMPHYCFNCVVYLAVYGFKSAEYSLQASSTGLTQIQSDVAVGGNVGQEKFTYYTFYNDKPFGEIKFILTTVRISKLIVVLYFDALFWSDLWRFGHLYQHTTQDRLFCEAAHKERLQVAIHEYRGRCFAGDVRGPQVLF
jgi:hypothetical protein